MKDLINRLINLGSDLSTRNALKKALYILGEEPDNADKLYIEIKNMVYKERMENLKPKDKIVFLPHCLRKADKCKAKIDDEGYDCNKCKVSECKINQIKKYAAKKGYKVFVVPGGSMVLNIINKYKPKGVIGVACKKELILALENLNIPGQSIELSKSGCINTDVDVEKVKKYL